MKLYRVMDVNGDNAGFADFEDDIEAERLADKYGGYSVEEIDTVKEVAEEMLVMLKSLEWCAEVEDSHGGYNEGCPQCSGTKPGSGDKEYEGHWAGCLLKGVIKKAEGRR